MLSPLTSERESITEGAPKPAFKKFCIVLIKPSKYDDDGYVIRFWKGVLPSNTLNVLHGLTEAPPLLSSPFAPAHRRNNCPPQREEPHLTYGPSSS